MGLLRISGVLWRYFVFVRYAGHEYGGDNHYASDYHGKGYPVTDEEPAEYAGACRLEGVDNRSVCRAYETHTHAVAKDCDESADNLKQQYVHELLSTCGKQRVAAKETSEEIEHS